MKNRNIIHFSSYFIYAILFIYLLNVHPYPGSYVIKAIPILSMALFLARELKSPYSYTMSLALFFSASGDIALDLDRTRYFIIGLVLFLISHIFYIITFLQDFQWNKNRVLPVAFVFLFGIIISSLLGYRHGGSLISVYIYIFIICFMAISCIFNRDANFMMIGGAILFMISDLIIAINKFLAPVSHHVYWIMVTYYTAQFMIGYGFFRAKKDKTGYAT